MSARAARFREIDVERAIKAARKAGAQDVRVDIDQAGNLSIIVGSAALLPARRNSFD